MPAKWLSSSSVSQRVGGVLEELLGALAQPARLRRLRQGLVVVFALWAVFALSRLIWALLPAGDSPLPADAVVINPVSPAAGGSTTQALDIARMQRWHLFGEAGAVPAATAAPEPPAPSARDGIEKGARETRLALKLRGVVSSSADGLGYAVIEYQSQQDIYAVEDKLPLPGQVSLAKVMPHQVILDNGGTYERLELFEESTFDSQIQATPAAAPVTAPAEAAAGPGPAADASAVARSYRERLYSNPQSLAEVVSISAVRENGQLLGYRLAPGKEQAQFEQLGLRAGDLVTSVNGFSLSDPANTLRLYQSMRSASEVVFDLTRNNQPLTLSVSLGDSAVEP